MKPIAILLFPLLALHCSQADDLPEAPSDENSSEEASSPSRWVKLHRPKDVSLLSAPCVVRSLAHATGNVSLAFSAQVVEVLVQVGDPVTKGQAIATVLAPEVMAAAAQYLGVSSRAKVHRERLATLQELRKEGMVKASAVFEQRALLSELSAEMRSSVAVLRMANLRPGDANRILSNNAFALLSPVDGIVATMEGHPGEVLKEATPIAQVVGKASARVEVTSANALRAGSNYSMVSADGHTYPLNPSPVSSIVAADTGMHTTWFALQESQTPLGDGQRCTVNWKSSEDQWEGPIDAIVTTSQGSMVWRKRKGEVERVVVTVVNASGASLWLQGPFVDGDQIAADGTIDLSPTTTDSP